MRRLLIILVAVATLSSCFKDEEYNTLFNIKTTVQQDSGGDSTPLSGAIAYLFPKYSDGYIFESYDDALAGIATIEESGEVVNSIGSAVGEDDLTLLRVSDRSKAIILVVDTENESYASAQLEIGMNLDNTYILLEFRPWQTNSFTQGSWTFVNTATVDED